MSNKVLLKKSSVGAKVPQTTDLDYGELALNYADGKLYFKDSSNTIQSFASLNATATLSNKTLNSPSLSTATLTGKTTLTGEVLIDNAGGAGGSSEGGELHFAVATANTTLNGPIAIDIYQNKIRFFETSGTNRGAYIDLSATGAGVGTNLLSGSGTGTVTSITAGTGLTGGNITSSGTIAIDTTVVTTLTGTQTLTNKTLTSPTINNATENNITLIGTVTAGSSVGTSGQVLQSTGTGVQWATISAGSGSGFPYVDAGLITDQINTSALVDGGTIV